MSDQSTTITMLKKVVEQFINERDWAQFHSPKNVSMSIACEAAELMELFLWVDTKDSFKVFETKRQDIENEVADIVMMVLEFCIINNIDLSTAIQRKLKLTAEKYPIEKSKGKTLKYSEL